MRSNSWSTAVVPSLLPSIARIEPIMTDVVACEAVAACDDTSVPACAKKEQTQESTAKEEAPDDMFRV